MDPTPFPKAILLFFESIAILDIGELSPTSKILFVLSLRDQRLNMPSTEPVTRYSPSLVNSAALIWLPLLIAKEISLLFLFFWNILKNELLKKATLDLLTELTE